MIKPTINRLKLANPGFFDPSLGQRGAIKDHRIEREEDGWKLKLRSLHDTYPVYSISATFELSYCRHGW